MVPVESMRDVSKEIDLIQDPISIVLCSCCKHYNLIIVLDFLYKLEETRSGKETEIIFRTDLKSTLI